MVALEAFFYISMLLALWCKRGRFTLFAVVQTAIFLEWPLTRSDSFWFYTDQINILLSLWMMWMVWELMPWAAYLLGWQCTVKLGHYSFINLTLANEFWQIPWMFYAGKVLDMAINLAVIWYCIQGEPNVRAQASRPRSA